MTTVLAGDIGGTKSALCLARFDGERVDVFFERVYASGGFAGAEALLAQFRAEAPCWPQTGCLAVAGPVQAGQAQLTNLPWRLTAAELALSAGLQRLELINDFSAVGQGIALLTPDDLHVLQPGVAEARGVRAVIGAGTGLGEAFMLPCGTGWHVCASEGSHADFAPADELQIELWRFLARRFGHVSWERAVSGPGIALLYDFFRQRAGLPWQDADPAAVVAAAEGGDALARTALELFLSLYGAEAGNLALKTLPAGGVYLAGGIAAKILPWFESGHFMAAFRAKGRYREWLERIPVRVVLTSRVGLLGAVRVAGDVHGL